MSKVAVVYWSGTGNTEAMAMAVAEGAKGKGAEVSVITAAEFSPEQVGEYSAIAFGCPSMGSEQLEESKFEPMFTACEGRLSGKNIALFGSYGWGDGEWMRSWESRCNDDGANLACESVICNEAPDDDALAACRELGASLARQKHRRRQEALVSCLLSGSPVSIGKTNFEPRETGREKYAERILIEAGLRHGPLGPRYAGGADLPIFPAGAGAGTSAVCPSVRRTAPV